ncbi:hypothetical protein PAXRUDRAFT_822605 [Paxillus rubicundulus Ve08.2h10]|uniref:Mid2 domain-containing protein n=1 Tax=Paxillus rubicundulus Ve08.2h10 TaxID=930991 RepID=A0A0D0E9P1_9AGAM|nr:hypothetical protein PAXRUDRAFT_822605 [Paxillus rubicundulus Ve08.2h10]
MKKATRSLLLLFVASAFILFALVPRYELLEGPKPRIQMRALLAGESTTAAGSTSAAIPSTSTAAPATSAQTSSSTTAAPTPTQASATVSVASSSSSTTPAFPPSSVEPVVIPTTTTDASGQVITSVVTVPNATSASAVPSQTDSSSSDSSGLGTGSIIGLSVAGGIAAIAIILFFVWKFTRKRFADFDDNEAIKWPELNAHGSDVHALPANSTGRAGFGVENDSDVNLARAPSPGGAYTHSIAASSVPEVYTTTQDPYAVPPLPHLNPNQPYRDDPVTYGQPAGYYDPYRGPIPNTFNDALSDNYGAESIPMTQMARTRSPAPQMAYDAQGRGSPAPQVAMGYGVGTDDRSRTPLGAGRTSPGPHAAYGYGPR